MDCKLWHTMDGFRENLDRQVYGTEITRNLFEELFEKTAETVRFTFNGWDGNSYDGESRNARVYRVKIQGLESVRFVKVGKGLHWIDETANIIEKATGEGHVEAYWFINVARA